MFGVLSSAIDWASTKCYSTIVSFQSIELKRQDILISVLPFNTRQSVDGGVMFTGKDGELVTNKQQLKVWVKSYIPSD